MQSLAFLCLEVKTAMPLKPSSHAQSYISVALCKDKGKKKITDSLHL